MSDSGLAASGIGASEGLAVGRQALRSAFVFGAVLICLGVFAVLAPLFTGVATAVLVGMLLVTGGIVETLFAFRAPSLGKGILTFLFGGLAVAAGVLVFLRPGEGLGALTLILAAYFVAAGAVDAIVAFKVRPAPGWGWALFSAILSIALGVFVVAQWPVSGEWAVGLFVGIRLLTHGWVLMALGVAGRDTLEYLQDSRLEALEGHVRTGLADLQEAQLALGAHAAVLLALDNELRKKVSTDEVDPAITELNARLGEAREHVERTVTASAEAWSAAQVEANAKFDALRKSAVEVGRRLQEELGIES